MALFACSSGVLVSSLVMRCALSMRQPVVCSSRKWVEATVLCTASTITVEPEQPVIATGPYALVRHPMYSGWLLMMLGVPVALGSWWELTLFPLLLLVTI